MAAPRLQCLLLLLLVAASETAGRQGHDSVLELTTGRVKAPANRVLSTGEERDPALAERVVKTSAVLSSAEISTVEHTTGGSAELLSKKS